MEKASQSTLSLAEPIGFLFLNTIFLWVSRLQKLLARLLSLHRSHPEFLIRSSIEKNGMNEVRGEFQLSREDVEMVMGSMGMDCCSAGEQLEEVMGFDELSSLFDEMEPSLEEVKAAFCVFDEDCDGFIDARELQSVLSKMGFGDALPLDACERMIEAHDENRDGRIDFNEFVRFMESSFC